MERVGLEESAKQLVGEVAKYSPSAGDALTMMLKNVCALGCASKSPEKTFAFGGAKAVIEEEVSRAKENLDNIEKIKSIWDQGVSVRCGGP